MLKTIGQKLLEIHEPQNSIIVDCIDYIISVIITLIAAAINVFLKAAVSIFVFWLTFTKLPILANMTREIVEILFINL